ncbi:hypothetical protein BGX24_008353 [Mortierella sp. AD032]|nr:hypothetical protein BGX24_008353 [Mortierella sp. AD032]
MSALLKTLTFNALQKEPILSAHCANHEFSRHTSKDGSSPDRLVFDGSRELFHYDNKILFKDLGSPLCLYRVGCTFPSAAHVEQTDKSAWWSALTHKATGNFFGFADIKGRIALRIRGEEVFLFQYRCTDGDRKSLWRATDGMKEQQSHNKANEPYLDALPQEMIGSLSAPETGDPALLEKLNKFVENNRIFKEDMLELLNYLASD